MPNIVSRIVELCVFRMKGDDAQFLVLKRSRNDGIYPGIWQLVTGVIEEGEKTVPAALRELKEETGFMPAQFWRLPVAHSFYEPVHDVVHVCPGFVARVPDGAEPVLSSEHESYEWCTAERALALLPWTNQREIIRMVHDRFVTETTESRLLDISHLKS